MGIRAVEASDLLCFRTSWEVETHWDLLGVHGNCWVPCSLEGGPERQHTLSVPRILTPATGWRSTGEAGLGASLPAPGPADSDSHQCLRQHRCNESLIGRA